MSSTINATQIRPLYTEALATWYDERLNLKASDFFRSFFKDRLCKERYPAYEVRRATETVATPVIRGQIGNRNVSQKSTLKVVDPFFFFEYFDATQQDFYQRLFASGTWNINTLTELVNGIGMQQMEQKKKIERAIEIYCSQVLETGIITDLKTGDTQLDFGRKAGSIVNLGSGNYWANSGTDPYKTFSDAGDWLRQNGKVQSYILNAIVGDKAIEDLLTNSTWLERQKLFNTRLDDVVPPTQMNTLARYHGTISAYNYRVRLWTYPEVYKDPISGDYKKYMNENKVIIMPENPDFEVMFGAVPQLVTPGAPTMSVQVADFVYKERIDEWMSVHEFGVQSSPMPVPVAIDTIYTAQVVGS
jgi:hypothetical protein